MLDTFYMCLEIMSWGVSLSTNPAYREAAVAPKCPYSKEDTIGR